MRLSCIENDFRLPWQAYFHPPVGKRDLDCPRRRWKGAISLETGKQWLTLKAMIKKKHMACSLNAWKSVCSVIIIEIDR